jgi:hypothetical protein
MPTGPVVSYRVQLRAFQQAVARFRRASARTDAVAAYGPLAEALWHAVTLDNRLSRHWQPQEDKPPSKFWFALAAVSGAETVPAVRWVRNAVDHQWADALLFIPYNRGGRYPPREHEWVWRPTEDIPGETEGRRSRRSKDGRDLVAEGREAYGRLLAGHPADFTLSILAEVYAEVAESFEPLRV